MKRRHLVLIALIMFLSGCSQGGPCGCRSAWVDAPPECGGGPKPDCEGNACADVKINYLGQGQGNQVKNNGTKKVKVSVKWFSGFGLCDTSSDMTLGPGQGQEWIFESWCKPYTANYADPAAPTTPVNPTPRITSLTITPNNVTAGMSVQFHVVLDRPAPPGGTRIGFSSITNTGLTATIKNMPLHWDFNAGVKEFSGTVHTERVTNDTTDIIFTAFNSVSKYSAKLVVR
jgi:hypothetical protein